jgi:class 3 adenylate cyclase/TolB-like protein
MATLPPNRRLAAILFADVAAYSRLMEQDETGTHVRVSRLFADVLEPAIARASGRLIKRSGDGVLADFPSATAALRCAVEVQRQVEDRNKTVRPRDQIRLRIGVNVADVLIDEQDIAGGGVNLAARLETLAPPGGICISQALKEQIQEDLGVDFVDYGTQRVKNISRPVRVFEVVSASGSASARWRARLRQVRASPRRAWVSAIVAVLVVATPLAWRWLQTAEHDNLDRLSVTVLPFSSDSPDPASRELASRLQRRLLLALSPESNMITVKGFATGVMPDARWDLERVRGELSARYAVVGEVAESGAGRRVEARLLDTATNSVTWGDSFEIPRRLANDSLEIVAKRVTPAVVQKVIELEVARVARSPPRSPDAMDLVLMGWAESLARKPGWVDRADERIKEALTVNPRLVPALLGRAELVSLGKRAPADDRAKAERDREVDQLTLAAVAADPECAASWTMRAGALAAMGQRDAALASVDKAVRINPANPWAVSQRLDLLVAAGRARDAMLPLDEVTLIYEKLNLADFMRSQCLARVYAADLDDAPRACETWYAMGGGVPALRTLVSVYGNQGEAEKAAKAVATLFTADPNTSIGAIRTERRAIESASPALALQVEQTFYAGLKRANLPE